MKALIAVSLLLTAAALNAQVPPPAESSHTMPLRLAPYASKYEVYWGSMNLGHAKISLTEVGADCYRYQSLTEAGALVRMFYGEPKEIAEFCLEDGQIRSGKLSFVNDRKSKESFTLSFDWSAMEVTGPGKQVRELPANAIDRFSMQEALRLWVMQNAGQDTVEPMTVVMVEDDRMKPYTFERMGEQVAKTPAGNFEAVLVERTDDPKKTVRYWFAPERGYQIVRFQRLKDGKPSVEMLLAK